MGNWAKYLQFLPLVQYVVAGIQQVHQDTINGATKQQLAKEALGLAVSVGDNLGPVIPGGAAVVDAAGGAVNVMIDQSVALFKALGLFTEHGTTQGVAPGTAGVAPSDIPVPAPASGDATSPAPAPGQ